MAYIHGLFPQGGTTTQTVGAYEDPVKIKANNKKDTQLIKIDDKYAQFIKTDSGDILFPDYIRGGLTCWLDANYNTRNGYDGKSAVWEDLSGNGNDFTIQNASGEYIWWTDTADYNALGYPIRYINPRGQAASCKIYRDGFNPWQMTQGWTMEFVFQAGTVENYHTLCRGVTDSNYREAWLTSGGAASIRVYNNTTVSASSAYTANTMHTISFRRNPGSSATASASMDIAVDGKHVTSTNTGATNVTTTKFFIYSRNANQYAFNGKVFGFRYYNRCLQREEVAWNARLDRIRYNNALTTPLDTVKYFDVLNMGSANVLLETNATLNKQANGTWFKARTTTSASDTQGVIYQAIDLTPYRFVNCTFNCTTDGGSDSYKVKLFAHSSAPAANTQSFTKSVDMGRATGNRWGLLDVSTLSGTYYVGLQTGTQLGTIMWLTAWA